MRKGNAASRCRKDAVLARCAEPWETAGLDAGDARRRKLATPDVRTPTQRRRRGRAATRSYPDWVVPRRGPGRFRLRPTMRQAAVRALRNTWRGSSKLGASRRACASRFGPEQGRQHRRGGTGDAKVVGSPRASGRRGGLPIGDLDGCGCRKRRRDAPHPARLALGDDEGARTLVRVVRHVFVALKRMDVRVARPPPSVRLRRLFFPADGFVEGGHAALILVDRHPRFDLQLDGRRRGTARSVRKVSVRLHVQERSGSRPWTLSISSVAPRRTRFMCCARPSRFECFDDVVAHVFPSCVFGLRKPARHASRDSRTLPMSALPRRSHVTAAPPRRRRERSGPVTSNCRSTCA